MGEPSTSYSTPLRRSVFQSSKDIVPSNALNRSRVATVVCVRSKSNLKWSLSFRPRLRFRLPGGP